VRGMEWDEQGGGRVFKNQKKDLVWDRGKAKRQGHRARAITAEGHCFLSEPQKKRVIAPSHEEGGLQGELYLAHDNAPRGAKISGDVMM